MKLAQVAKSFELCDPIGLTLRPGGRGRKGIGLKGYLSGQIRMVEQDIPLAELGAVYERLKGELEGIRRERARKLA